MVALLLAAAALAAGESRASDAAIALGELSVSSPTPGVDRAALKNAAESELLRIDASKLPRKKRLIVSLAVVRTADSPVECTVNALLRDGKTGSMVAILEGRAHAEGGASAELRGAVLRAAVRVAVRQIPEALAAK